MAGLEVIGEWDSMSLKKAISEVEKYGMLLVFPLNNRKEPASLWSCLHPGSEMRWEWDSGGDDRVARLWHLRAQLSDSRQVVYSKWYQGRATVFSRELFTCLLALMGTSRASSSLEIIGDPYAREIIRVLEQDSPLSPKVLRDLANLKGKNLSSTYDRAIKSLWRKLLVVGFGEVEDGAFPSLAVGATKVIFEDLWEESKTMSPVDARKVVMDLLPTDSVFRKAVEKELLSPLTSETSGVKKPNSVHGKQGEVRLGKPSKISFEELGRRKRF